MPLRLIEVTVPSAKAEEIPGWLGERSVLALWRQEISPNASLVKILLEAKETEPVLDELEKNLGAVDGFRAILTSVEATLPRPPEPEDSESEQPEAEAKSAERISREELYNDISEGARITGVYLVTVVLSTVVGSIGLIRDDLAVIIGAMVIAPLLGPNVSLALGTALGDTALIRRSLRTNLAGLLTALALAVLLALFLEVDPSVPSLASRTRATLGDIALALASGSAGALAFTSGIPAALIGVMVAVALLPPLAAAGLLAGSGRLEAALGAFLLVAVNVICVNLAGVVTFLAQGVRPRAWWDADRARRASRNAILLWAALLALLGVLIVLSRQ